MAEAVVNGVRLVYQVSGSAGGPPALMVCGTGQTATMWRNGGFLSAVEAAGCSVISFDNRGMPPSECPTPPWTVADMAADAVALIEHLGLGPCHVIGGSLGALITQTVALTRSDLVRSATLMVGGGNFCRAAQLGLRGQVELLEKGVEFPDAMRHAGMLEAVLTPEQRQDDSMVDGVLELIQGLASSFGPGGEHGQLNADAGWGDRDHLAELAGISVPCLVIAAEHDAFFPPAHMRRVADTIPDARYVEIPGSPHVTSDPAGLKIAVTALSQFLRQH